MNAETAERIVRECEVHNNGLRTLRECAELAGYTRDYAIKAYQVFADTKIAAKKAKVLS